MTSSLAPDLAHRRLPLLWALALLGLSAPWLLTLLDLERWTDLALAGRACSLASIHDGDTLRADCAGDHLQVRLHCIDAPELAQAPWGRESRDHLRAITPEQIEIRVHETDRYGRTVAEIMTPEGLSLNQRMVRDGQAAVYHRYCTDPLYGRLEAAARARGLGIWARPGDHQTPWAHRRSSG